jgi:GxxExxY protein
MTCQYAERGANLMKFERETGILIGCGFEVLRILGHGLMEKPYENALVVEFRLQHIPCLQQTRFCVNYIPDLIAFDAVIVDTKVIPRITDQEVGQMLNYLKITGLAIGMIMNFHRPKLEWRRVVL